MLSSVSANLINGINSHTPSFPLSLAQRHQLRASLSGAGESIMATNSVRVAAAQMTSTTDLAANFATCSRLVKEAALAGAKLLCFPEAFSFVGAKDGDSVRIAEPLDGPIMEKYCSLARESSIWLSLGGFQEKGLDPEHLFNTHIIVDDTGKIRSSYRKIHLFDVDVPGGRVYKESSFTEAAATQAGKHNDKRESYGDTLIIDPWGTIVSRLPDRLSTGIVVADIDLSLVYSVREKMPIAKQRKPIDFWKAASL